MAVVNMLLPHTKKISRIISTGATSLRKQLHLSAAKDTKQETLMVEKEPVEKNGAVNMKLNSHAAKLSKYLQETVKIPESSLPPKLLNRHRSSIESLYLVDPSVAKIIMKTIKKKILSSKSPVLEANPGLGLLSKELLKSGVKELYQFEPMQIFHPRLKELAEDYPSCKNYIQKHSLMEVWKIVYQDKIDNGERFNSLIAGIKPKALSDESPAMKIIGACPSRSFLKHMIYIMAFQTGLMKLGRPEYFLFLNSYNYIHITCDRKEGFKLYRPNSVIFQLFYKTTLLEKLPRKAFLPWEKKNSASIINMLSKVQSFDAENMYLVHIEPRIELLEELKPEQLPLLFYFVRHNLNSRHNRVIPTLERWIPDCGPRLIYMGYTIFTEFGDLSPTQILQLFKIFISWPEFYLCPFIASMETSFMKNDPASDEVDKEVDGDTNIESEIPI